MSRDETWHPDPDPLAVRTVHRVCQLDSRMRSYARTFMGLVYIYRRLPVGMAATGTGPALVQAPPQTHAFSDSLFSAGIIYLPFTSN